MPVYMFFAIVFLIAIVLLVFQNTMLVTVHFLNWVSPEISLALVILVTVGAGALLTFLLDSIRYFKIAKRIKELTDTNNELQQELFGLEKKYKLSQEQLEANNNITEVE
jgi:uncharacterized integral membrane protein